MRSPKSCWSNSCDDAGSNHELLMAHLRSLTEDTAYNLFADSQRMHLLTILQRNGEMDIDKLASRIAAREEKSQRQIKIALVHKHLPLLEDHNIIQYDTETVTPMDVLDELEQYIDDQGSVLDKLIRSY